MYTIKEVVRRDVARHFGIEGLSAHEQYVELSRIVREMVEGELPHQKIEALNLERALKMVGWVIAPDSHPGYCWHFGSDQRGRVMEYALRTLPVVWMSHRDHGWPWWYMEEPNELGHAADLIREILADVKRIKRVRGEITKIPGPAPEVA